MPRRRARGRNPAHRLSLAQPASLAGFALAAILLLLGCESTSPGSAQDRPTGERSHAPQVAPRAPGEPAGRAPEQESELVSSLVSLGDKALARGELELAESRYRRALSVDPRSRRARIGLIDAFVRSGRQNQASALLEEVLASATGPQRVDALILLAEIEAGRGHRAAAREALTQALALDEDRYNAHQQLADLIEPVPSTPALDDGEVLRRASHYPYDPASLLAGARVRVATGDEAGAIEWLEDAVWLADIDAASSRRAAALLAQIDSRWKQRRVVYVHVYADESVRRESGWRMRMRMVWRSTSQTLDSLLRVAFVPVSIRAFQSASGRSDLASINAGFYRSVQRIPPEGLVAALTDRAPPKRRGSHALGVAQFLGRELVARLTPGEIVSRTLIHEVLHIYGGVHVADKIESLMNPSGESLDLDVGNQAIALLVRNRRFGPGGIETNVLRYTEVDDLIAVYLETLRVNLGLRRQGVKQARAELSRYVAAELGNKALQMDSHLADVAKLTGSLLERSGDPDEALALYQAAARLYDPGSRRGREMQQKAESLSEEAVMRRALERR